MHDTNPWHIEGKVAIGLFQDRMQPCAAMRGYVQEGRLGKLIVCSYVQLLAVMRRE